MALQLDLEPGDSLIVPPESGAHIRVVEKSGRRTRLSVESALPVQVVRARNQRPAATPGGTARPVPSVPVSAPTR